jgi:tRNA nucleotidyltransferase (CCA-adding enzyme)
LGDEIRLAKSFAHAQNCYGAESYIHGFSGYGLELLISYYGSFLKFIKAVVGYSGKKIVIDPMKFYGRGKVLNELNESKTSSPMIFIDPTFKERNALAGLNDETFNKFREVCKKFLKKPSVKFFDKIEVAELFKKYPDVKIVKIKTNKQAGDIAGSKSKKFFEFFVYSLKKEFEIKKQGFDYDDKKNVALFYFVLEKRGVEVVRGPPVTSVHHLSKFKKAHKGAFIKNHIAYAKIQHKMSFEQWFKWFKKKEVKIIKEMGISEVV